MTRLRITALSLLAMLVACGATNQPIPAGFSLALAVDTLTVARGASTLVGVTVSRRGGLKEAVGFTLEGAPEGVSVSGGVAADSTSGTLTIAVTAGAPLGTVEVTLVATAGGMAEREPLDLTVVAAAGPGDPGEPIESSHFFLWSAPEVTNTSNPTVVTDGDGGVHTVFPAYAVGNAYYAYCPADCRSYDDATVLTLETDGTVTNVMIDLDAAGNPRVLISTYLRVYYASCDGDCTEAANWTKAVILEHNGEREITGEAFALDPQGSPHFLMHTFRSALGVGQGPPATWYASCYASDCHDAAGWEVAQIATQIWQGSTLRFTADGRPRLGTVATVAGDTPQHIVAYLECDADCDVNGTESWTGTGLNLAFSDRFVAEIDFAVSLALTAGGAPRLFALGQNDLGRNLGYYACDADCTDAANWAINLLLDGDIGPGVDLALDESGRPRAVYTFSGHIFMTYCDGADALCQDDDADSAAWKIGKVELASDLVADGYIPGWNCTVAAWSLREPSLALGLDGLPRVAYRADDISGGFNPNPDPTRPPCSANLDMTLARYAQLGSLDR